MSVLWRIEALVGAKGGRPVGVMPDGVSGLSIDTRSLKPGEAFFAITGDQRDGHDFATAAVKAGAGLLVVAEGKLPALGRIGAPLIVVPDVLAALVRLSAAARLRFKGKVIGVTGSAGKTTTKEALRVALGAIGKVHASEKSYNNHWGVPLMLAGLPEDADYGVFEIGMNHPDEIRPLVKLVRPHIAIVTMIAAAHLGHFSSLEEIARAKAEIFEGVEPGGHALVNRDDKQWKLLDRLARDAGIEHVWGFGENARSTFRLVSHEAGPTSSRMTVKMAGRELAFSLGVPGRHMVQNALAVLGAVYLAGADVDRAASALTRLEPEEGRGRRYRLAHPKGGEFVLVDESYNANPASMRAALDLLHAADVAAGGRRIAVLGDMLELGTHSRKLHAELADPVRQSGADIVLLAGPEMTALADELADGVTVEHRAGVDDLVALLRQTVMPGDVVVVKSSKGIGFSKLVRQFLDTYPAAGRAAQRTETIG
jgi:UDP-N-acetylmuramoyl-tripeptide--D-alanyl-D-alanine ligase